MTYMTMLEKVMTKKGHQIFGQEEGAPPRENPGYAYGWICLYTRNAVSPIEAEQFLNNVY